MSVLYICLHGFFTNQFVQNLSPFFFPFKAEILPNNLKIKYSELFLRLISRVMLDS
jgi:hypothetical protein